MSSKPARLRFYLNEAGVETFSESGTPGPGSTTLQPGDECTIPPNPACDQLVESTGFEALEALSLLAGADNVPGAIEFLAQEDPIPLMLTAFDANGDESLGFEELLSADLLNVARSVVSGLGLDPGPGHRRRRRSAGDPLHAAIGSRRHPRARSRRAAARAPA